MVTLSRQRRVQYRHLTFNKPLEEQNMYFEMSLASLAKTPPLLGSLGWVLLVVLSYPLLEVRGGAASASSCRRCPVTLFLSSSSSSSFLPSFLPSFLHSQLPFLEAVHWPPSPAFAQHRAKLKNRKLCYVARALSQCCKLVHLRNCPE